MSATLKRLSKKVWRRVRELPYANVHIRDPFEAACRRLDNNGLLHNYRHSYLFARNQKIGDVLEKLLSQGELDEAWLRTAAFSQCDERVVEYPVVAAEFIRAGRNGRFDCADVGCVLNNRLMEETIKKHVNWMWFFNASIEPPSIHGNVAYLEADLRTCDVHQRLQFPLVTCLSTLEHIGMDNTRYGGTGQEFDGPPPDPEKFAIQGVENLRNFVAPGGTLLISVPYGPFEYVRSFYDPAHVIYYVFDAPRIQSMINVLNDFTVEANIFKVIPGAGWVRTDLQDQSLLPFGKGISSCGGVAILKAVRRVAVSSHQSQLFST